MSQPVVPAVRGHAFISYVREDKARVDRLQQALEDAGVPVWRDTRDLWPGQDWRSVIRRAISEDAMVFLACFSDASATRESSYQNEELLLGIDQLRQRSPQTPLLIPVRFDDCAIPDRDLGGGRTLASIQCADLFGDTGADHLAKLIATVRQILGRKGKTASSPARHAPATGSAEPAGGDLARLFDQHVRADVSYLKTRGYNPSRFTALIAQSGGVLPAAKRLLADPRSTFYGFQKLWEMGELARSVEFAANLPWFQSLFTDQELQAGRTRLELHDFPVEARLADATANPPAWAQAT